MKYYIIHRLAPRTAPIHHSRRWLSLLLLVFTLTLTLVPAANTHAATLPPGFQDTTAIDGLNQPTAFRFASDGRIFVAEKSGLVKVFDNLNDTTPTVFADLRTNVHNFWDRGLLGLELDPNFPTNPYVYVLYAHDAAAGGVAPRWGSPGATSDPCPNPPGATTDGCVISGRLSRLQANGNSMVGSEQVLVEGWCQQFPSHSMGSIVFGSDGALYASGGEGASFDYVDYGQSGGSANSPTPKNPCGDPPGGVGGSQVPPTAEGGSLRSQSLRRPAGEPVLLNGTVIRVNPATGAGMPDNPLASSTDANARRIVAYGLRNPMRMTRRPGTNELWIGDVGGLDYEEIDRIVNPTAGPLNFGWPCYEGPGRMPGFDAANLNICENLYNQPGAVTAPFFSYYHYNTIGSNDTCPVGSSSITGVAFQFYNGNAYPSQYNGALFFGDYSRSCIWVMFKGANGLPDPTTVTPFIAPAEHPVDLQISPSGELFYADFYWGRIRRVQYFSANQPPTAVASASATSGPAPLEVQFDASASSDPDPGNTLAYAWDLDGDGQYDDSTALQPSYTYTQPGTYSVGLRVSDNQGATASTTISITAGNTPPSVVIDTPLATMRWKVGDIVNFSGHATDQQQGTLPASALTWSLIMHHCPSNCHQHPVQDFPGMASGSFSAPDHEYPSYLELRLTATDAGGLSSSSSIQLDPQTTQLTFQTTPSGLQLAVGSIVATTPFNRIVIAGSNNSLSATSPQVLGGTTYTFSAWSDTGAQSHNIIAGASPVTYTAAFASLPANNLLANGSFELDANNDGRPDTWSSNSKFTRSNAVIAHQGSFVGRHFATDSSGHTITQIVSNLTAGTSYATSCWVNIPSASVSATYKVQIRWRSASNSNIRTDTIKTYTGPTNGWSQAATSLIAPSGTTGAQMRLSASKLNGTVYVDDCTVQGAAGDSTAPSVVARTPSSGATNIDPAANITATFDEAVTGVSNTTFTLTPLGGSTAVAAIVSYDAATKTATLNPNANLAAGTTYVAQLSGSISDAAGNLLAATNWSFTTASSSGGSFSFSPVADTYVNQANPTTSYAGASTFTIVGGSSLKRAFLRFNINGLPAGVAIRSAKLRLYVTNDSTSGGIFSKVGDIAWPEQINWNTQPAISGPEIATLGAVGPGATVEVDLTAAITGNGTYSFAITMPSTISNNLAYASREASTTTTRPQLVILVQ